MNKKIRGMIDSIFADMKMSAENLALRDELMANATARFEDSMAEGKSEEEAFAEVAASLEDVRATLIEMEARREAEAASGNADTADNDANDFADAVGKAFDAIGDFGKQFIPQMGKFAQQADEATGKVFSEFGRAVGKGAIEVGRVAGETFEKIAKNIQEATAKKPLTEEELLARAKEIRIQAEIRQEADDQEGARELRRKAYELEMQAEALRKAKEAAGDETTETETVETEAVETEAEMKTEESEPDFIDEAVSALEEDVSALEEDVRRVIESFDGEVHEDNDEDSDGAVDADVDGIHFEDAPENVVVINRFDAEAIQSVEIGLDADDVEVITSDMSMVEVEWDSCGDDSTQPVARIEDGVLKINRRNPDVFKTFFSVFKKEGGKVIVRVPDGVVLSYKISTTSGDVIVDHVPMEAVKANTTSGIIRIVPDSRNMTGTVSVNSVSGKVEIDAEAEKIEATTVSGNQMIAAKAGKIDLSSVSGRIECEGAADTYDVDSVSGNLAVTCLTCPDGSIKISTVSGSAKVALPEEIKGFKVQATGIGGLALNDFGVSNYGTCALPIRFDSMSGRLSIVKRNV